MPWYVTFTLKITTSYTFFKSFFVCHDFQESKGPYSLDLVRSVQNSNIKRLRSHQCRFRQIKERQERKCTNYTNRWDISHSTGSLQFGRKNVANIPRCNKTFILNNRYIFPMFWKLISLFVNLFCWLVLICKNQGCPNVAQEQSLVPALAGLCGSHEFTDGSDVDRCSRVLYRQKDLVSNDREFYSRVQIAFMKIHESSLVSIPLDDSVSPFVASARHEASAFHAGSRSRKLEIAVREYS